METLSLIGNAFAGMMNPMSILLLIVGVAVGIVFGSIPGLSAAMAVALFLPVTFAMQSHEAFTLLVALYIGGISGGLISAILINIPGTSSSIATCFDGSPMAKKGEAGKALGTGVVFSFLGGLFSFLVLMFVAPSVAQITLKFSAIEYFGVCLFALSMIAALAGTSMIKGLLSGCLGLIIALVGMAPIDGTKRFTFGINELSSGFDILPTLIGIFAIAEVLAYAEEVKKMGKATQIKQSFKIKGFGFTWKEFVGQKWNALRSALIGTGIGILPGIGGSTAGILSWMTAKKTSKHPPSRGGVRGVCIPPPAPVVQSPRRLWPSNLYGRGKSGVGRGPPLPRRTHRHRPGGGIPAGRRLWWSCLSCTHRPPLLLSSGGAWPVDAGAGIPAGGSIPPMPAGVPPPPGSGRASAHHQL